MRMENDETLLTPIEEIDTERLGKGEHIGTSPEHLICYFAVVSKTHSENRLATENVFGFVKEDLELLVRAYCKATDIDGYREGRITFSKNRDTNCDLTDASIPSNFPYITIAGANYIWSHVSLYGFHCHLAFLIHKVKNSFFYKKMMESGAKDEWLRRVREMSTNTHGARVIA